MKQQIQDVDDAFRDSHSKAIIFNDKTKYQQHLVKRARELKRLDADKRIDQIEKDVSSMKSMLTAILEKL